MNYLSFFTPLPISLSRPERFTTKTIFFMPAFLIRWRSRKRLPTTFAARNNQTRLILFHDFSSHFFILQDTPDCFQILPAIIAIPSDQSTLGHVLDILSSQFSVCTWHGWIEPGCKFIRTRYYLMDEAFHLNYEPPYFVLTFIFWGLQEYILKAVSNFF